MSKPVKDDAKTFLPPGKNVVVGGVKFNIQPFVLKNRTKILEIFFSVYKELSKEDLSGQSDMGQATMFIQVAGPKLIEIYEVVLGRDQEWLGNNMQLKDEVSVILAVMEVNDFPFLIRQMRALMPHMKR